MPDPADFFQPADAPENANGNPAPPGGLSFPSDAGGPNAASPGSLELVKHGQRYVFDCPPGKEADTLAQLAVLIDDESNDLTWFDAALLCHQLGQRMGRRLSHLKRPA